MPNAWDIGSARLLVSLGFEAIATTSSGHAASLGRGDQEVSRDELVSHVEALAAAVDVPVSVDAERCFPDDPGGVARTVELRAAAGAACCSVEDYYPATGSIDALDVATERVAEAVEAARKHGLVLTARAENHLYGIDDLDEPQVRQAAKLLERENERLVRQVFELKQRLAAMEGHSVSQMELLADLEHQLALRNKKTFGDSSEKRPTPKTPADRVASGIEPTIRSSLAWGPST